MEYWKKAYPGERRPGIYFVNPKGFKDRETTSPEELREVNEDAAFKEDLRESESKARTRSEIDEEFSKTYPRLMADRGKKVLVFDTCIHSGDTLASVVDTFDRLGFKDVKVGSVNPADYHSKVQTDFHITKERPEMGCYPFDRDRMIEKTFEHVYSKRGNDKEKKAAGIALRKEIKKIMQENLEVEKQ
jgi:hypoxanthine phosphoribosyltransferase